MIRQFVKLFSTNFRKIQAKTKMPQVRFFPNLTPDYSDGSEAMPEEFLTKFVVEIEKDIARSLKPTEENADDGLYLGTAGISYMYYHLQKVPALSQHKSAFLSRAAEYLLPTIEFIHKTKVDRKDVPSFILGNCGVYALASVLFLAMGDKTESDKYRIKYYDAAAICKEKKFLTCGSDELFVGRAGYVLGALWLAKETNTEIQKDDIYTLCNIMVDSGRDYAKQHNSPCPLMYCYYQVEYLGAAHGLCSILQVLLSVPGYLDSNPGNIRDIKTCVDYLLSLQTIEGNFPCSIEDIDSKEDLIHWCHGAGGMVYLMAKAYLLWKEEKYLTSCERIAELIWQKGLLRKGPGLCHGVAGNGYVFLLLYRMKEDAKYLYRAGVFAKFLKTGQFVTGARIPDHPFSLFEGIAGTACFVADITNPRQAAFPFLDVF